MPEELPELRRGFQRIFYPPPCRSRSRSARQRRADIQREDAANAAIQRAAAREPETTNNAIQRAVRAEQALRESTASNRISTIRSALRAEAMRGVPAEELTLVLRGATIDELSNALADSVNEATATETPFRNEYMGFCVPQQESQERTSARGSERERETYTYWFFSQSELENRDSQFLPCDLFRIAFLDDDRNLVEMSIQRNGQILNTYFNSTQPVLPRHYQRALVYSFRGDGVSMPTDRVSMPSGARATRKAVIVDSNGNFLRFSTR